MTGKDDRSMSNIPLIDVSLVPDRKEPVDGRIDARIGSLSSVQSSWQFFGHGAVDAALTFGPVFFFTLAGLCVGLNNKPSSQFGDGVKAMTLVSPTIFPIIYAAILGKLLRRVGHYKAERGTTIGDLERLIGCQSLFSTLERQVGLGRLDVLGCSVLLAWLLSPMGGQASLRLLSIRPFIDSHTSTILYHPIDGYVSQTSLPITQDNSSASTLLSSLFVTALQTSRNRVDNAMDLFGNVRIPDMATLSSLSSMELQGNWRLINNETQIGYTSVFGVPVAGIPEAGNATFDLKTHYWAVNCTAEDKDGHLLQNIWRRTFSNVTEFAELKPRAPSFRLIIDEQNSSDSNIIFQYQTRTTINDTIRSIASITCSTIPLVVQSKILCRDRICRVAAIRNLHQDPVKVWSDFSPIAVFKAISSRLPGVDISVTQEREYESELLERWIYDPNLNVNTFKDGYADLSFIDAAIFRQRLQSVINTFWDSALGADVRMDLITKDKVDYEGHLPVWTKTDVQIKEFAGLRYICNIELAILTMIISVILLAAAIGSMILGIIVRTPDSLGFVSTIAKDSRYFNTHVPSHISGLDAARALRDVRVRIGDVKSEGEIGHIALATLDVTPARLSWTRMYD